MNFLLASAVKLFDYYNMSFGSNFQKHTCDSVNKVTKAFIKEELQCKNKLASVWHKFQELVFVIIFGEVDI